MQALKRHSRQKGSEGEDRAAAWLRSQGWTIRERNFRTRKGEVDIIAEKGPLVAFFEVKTWGCLPASELEYSVSARKRARIEQTARFYLASNPRLAARRLRFDVLFLVPGTSEIRHIEDAFQGGAD
ncbi:MAG TPA: YraN family protein [Spirochaetia bacterium]|nr:YraN family protein [Spirochaetia bacterium]